MKYVEVEPYVVKVRNLWYCSPDNFVKMVRNERYARVFVGQDRQDLVVLGSFIEIYQWSYPANECAAVGILQTAGLVIFPLIEIKELGD